MNVELTKMLDKAIEESTFSLEAVKSINAIRERAKDLETRYDSLRSDYEKLSSLNSRLTAENGVIREREEAVRAREVKMTELEQSVAVSKAVANAYERQFDRLFANRVVRERTSSQIPYTVPGSTYPSFAPQSTDITKEEG